MGQISQAFGIYHIIEIILKAATDPMTCVDLFDTADVKKFAATSNRVSDYLGHMWRKGLIGRVPAPAKAGSSAKWAYFWRTEGDEPAPALMGPRAPKKVAAPEVVPAVVSLIKKPSIEISDSGGVVVIDLPGLVITIKTK